MRRTHTKKTQKGYKAEKLCERVIDYARFTDAFVWNWPISVELTD